LASPNHISKILLVSTFQTADSTRLSLAFGIGYFSLFLYSGLGGSWDLIRNHKELTSVPKEFFIDFIVSMSILFSPAYFLSMFGIFNPAFIQKRPILEWYLLIFLGTSLPSIGIMAFLSLCLWGA